MRRSRDPAPAGQSAGSVGTVDVTVTTNNGTSATGSADQFTYQSLGVPTVTSLGASTGTTAGGTSVTITGTNLSDATAVRFGAAAGIITIDTATSIVVTSPAGAAGIVDVIVSTPGGTSALSPAARPHSFRRRAAGSV